MLSLFQQSVVKFCLRSLQFPECRSEMLGGATREDIGDAASKQRDEMIVRKVDTHRRFIFESLNSERSESSPRQFDLKEMKPTTKDKGNPQELDAMGSEKRDSSSGKEVPRSLALYR